MEIPTTSARCDGESQGSGWCCPGTTRGEEKGLRVEHQMLPTQLSDGEASRTRNIHHKAEKASKTPSKCPREINQALMLDNLSFPKTGQGTIL